MPRRGSGGRPAPRAAPRAAPVRNPPQKATPAPPPAHAPRGESMLGGIGSTIAQGMAFGGGSAIAHRAVDAMMGPRSVQVEHVSTDAPATAAPVAAAAGGDACSIHLKAFQDCFNSNGADVGKCQFYMDMLSECQKNSRMLSA